MTEPEYNAQLASGAIKVESEPEESTPAASSTSSSSDISVEQFIPLLLQLQSTQRCLTAAPTFIPQTFQDQIQFVYSSGTYYLYLYFNNAWNSFTAGGGGGSGVIQLLAGFGIALSPGGGTGTVTVSCTITDATLPMSNITTNDVSTTQHGFAPKLPNDATKFLNGVGVWAVPSGGGGGVPNSLFLTGSGLGPYLTSSTTLVDVDATNLKGTISGLSIGSKLLIRVWFRYLNNAGSGTSTVQLTDLTNSAVIATLINTNGPAGGANYYAELLYGSPSTSIQMSLQYKCGNALAFSEITNISTNSNELILQALNSTSDAVSASPGNSQIVFIWVQQIS